MESKYTSKEQLQLFHDGGPYYIETSHDQFFLLGLEQIHCFNLIRPNKFVLKLPQKYMTVILKLSKNKDLKRARSFSTYAKFSEKVIFLTPWYAHLRDNSTVAYLSMNSLVNKIHVAWDKHEILQSLTYYVSIKLG